MKEKLRDKKVVYTIIGIISLLLVVIGITYAYWLVTKTQTNSNVISSACLDITLSDEANDITLTNQFPMSDEDGMNLTPYEFTVTNNCNTSVDYHINLESIGTESTAIDSGALKAVIDENTPRVLYDYVGAETTVSGAYTSNTLVYGTLSASSTTSDEDTKSHSLRLWIDEDAPISEMNKTYTGKISVMIGQGISSQGTTLSSLIIADAEANGYLYSTTPNFNTVTADGEYGLYSAEDDLGTSYYFRGDVENNYVKFGMWQESSAEVKSCFADSEPACSKGTYDSLEDCTNAGESYCKEFKYADVGDAMYWRILRINGDGTIRLVYDGPKAVANGTSHLSVIKRTAYNTATNNAKYVGYTYNTSDTDDTQINSTIKGAIDEWYVSNLKNDYVKYIADTIFCNAKEISTSGSTIAYNPGRLIGTPTVTPSLKCTKEEDRYTISPLKGNGVLTHPISLLSADEVAMAGGRWSGNNTSYYLYAQEVTYTWLLSPYNYTNNYSYVWIIGGDGDLRSMSVSSAPVVSGARPVINLKADVLFTGTGTIDDPYVITTN